VVFDAGQSYRPATKKKHSGITVQFAPHGQTADRLIKERVRRVKNPQAMIVVTSDRAVQQAAQQMGVRVVTAQEFGRQLLNLSAAAAPNDEDVQANRQLSADEVEEWLSIFAQGKDESDNPAH
jgi:predicted RNA-binding protein with PIN domain